MEKEFTNYKEKAKSILNYKDELIASLKGDNGAVSNGDLHSNSSEELTAEITALKWDSFKTFSDVHYYVLKFLKHA